MIYWSNGCGYTHTYALCGEKIERVLNKSGYYRADKRFSSNVVAKITCTECLKSLRIKTLGRLAEISNLIEALENGQEGKES